MHVISKQTFKAAEHHAHIAAAHGKALEQMGESLTEKLVSQEQGIRIAQAGRQIQHHAHVMLALIEAALQDE